MYSRLCRLIIILFYLSAMMLDPVLRSFNLNPNRCKLTEFGSGLINRTWKVDSKDGNHEFVLQKINEEIFRKPEDIASNIKLVADFLTLHYPDYLFVSPVK